MMENHSYDNRLDMLFRPGTDGFRIGRDGLPAAANPYPNGQIQHAFRMPTTYQLPSRPSQEWTASHKAYDNGRMDGFVSTPIDPLTTEIVGGVAMGYWQGQDQPFYYSVYRQFPRTVLAGRTTSVPRPMLDMLDLRRPSFADPAGLAQPPAVADPSALTCSVTGPGTIPPPVR